MLMPVVVDIPGLVRNDEIVAALIDGVLKDHKVGDQHLVHAANSLEGVQIVLARLKFDVPRLAGEPRTYGMDALASGLEQPSDRILREPVHLEVRMELAQLARNGKIAARVAKTDRG